MLRVLTILLAVGHCPELLAQQQYLDHYRLAPELLFRSSSSAGHPTSGISRADFSGDPTFTANRLRYNPNFEILVIGGPYFTELDFREIENLKRLQVLILDSSDISEESVEGLKTKRPNLLILRSEKYAIEQLRHSFPNLAVAFEIDNSRPNLTNFLGEEHFRVHTKAHFRLDAELEPQRPLSLEKLRNVKYLKKLDSLDLSFAMVDDVHLHYLRELPVLKKLRLPFTYISVEAVEELLSSTKLEALTLVVEDSYRPDESDKKIQLMRTNHPEVTLLDLRE